MIQKRCEILILLIIISTGVFATTPVRASLNDESTVASAASLNAEADDLRRQWTDEAISRSIDLYFEASHLWRKAKRLREAAICLQNASELMLWGDRTTEAIRTLNQALALETPPGKPDDQAETFYLLTIASLKNNDLKSAVSYWERTVVLSRDAGDSRIAGLAELAAGEIRYRSRDIAAMVGHQERALQNFISAGDEAKQTETLRYLSYSYVMNNERLKGVELSKKSVDIARHLNDRRL